MSDADLARAIAELPGWCTPEKALRLAELAAGARAALCVEIGVFGGRSLIALASGLARSGLGRVDGIDPYTRAAALEGTNGPVNDQWWSAVDYKGVMESAARAVEQTSLGSRARIIRKRALEAVGGYADGSIDILHQDGNRSEEVSLAETRAWMPKIRAGGLWILESTNWRSTWPAQELLEASGFVRSETYETWTVFRKMAPPARLRPQLCGYFDSVFCLALDSRPDRWEKAQAELEACGIECTRVSSNHWKYAVAGCMTGHRGIWQQVAGGRWGDRVLILEDDFKLITRTDLLGAGYREDSSEVAVFDSCPGATLEARFGAMVRHIPDKWDLLYLGGIYTSLSNVRVSPHVLRAGSMLSLHSYGISREYAARVTRAMDSLFPREVSMPVDLVLERQSRCGEAVTLTLSPRLFTQRTDSFSDISKRVHTFHRSMVDADHELAARSAQNASSIP
jgi:methyltransferase family protein